MTDRVLDGDMEEGEVLAGADAADRRQIGLTEEGRRRLERLKGTLKWFDNHRDAARFALAYAVRHDAKPDDPGTVRTAWSLDTFDRGGELVALLAALHPGTTTPVRLIQGYIDVGLRLIEERLNGGETSPVAFLD